jgi:hypothetical protein
VVHGILTRDSGNIAVSNNIGEGREFTLSLPAVPQRHATTPLHTMVA